MQDYSQVGPRASRAVDPYLVATTKLSQDWSANRCVPHVNDEWLEGLLADERFLSIDAMTKVRLLLAGMIAINQPTYQHNEEARADLQGALGGLQRAAAGDADEWVKVMAAAAGGLDGRLDLDSVMQQSAVVQETVAALKQQVEESTNQQLFPPLEDVYLNSNPSVLIPNSGHFKLRSNPRVQPLSTNVSYAAATPPPPPIYSPRQTGDQHVAAFLRSHSKQQQLQHRASLGRTFSQSGLPDAAAAAAAAAAGPPLSRAKSGMGVKVQKIQMLGEVQQKEMQDVLQKSLKAKGHGVAAHVRHEQVPGFKPRTSESGGHNQQQLQQHDSAGPEEGAPGELVMQYMDYDGSEEDNTAAAGDEVEDEGGRTEGKQQRRQRAQRTAAAAARIGGRLGGPSAAAAARVTDAQIDELFADSDDDEDYSPSRQAVPATTGMSRSAKALQHHKGEMEDIEAPDELQDEMEVEGFGEAAAEGGGDASGGQGAGRSGENDQVAAAAAAKRRRVIVESDDDD